MPNVSVSGLAFSISIVVPFLNMTKSFAGNIGQVSHQVNAVVMGIAGTKRIFALLDEAPEGDEGYVTLVNAKEVNGEYVAVSYTHLIIGGTGSAKSTLVNLISRLYDVTEGSVKVGGRDVREYDIEALRSNVAVVLQKNQLDVYKRQVLSDPRVLINPHPLSLYYYCST